MGIIGQKYGELRNRIMHGQEKSIMSSNQLCNCDTMCSS